uniref:PEHE domain-containing protein n=1 Tax=Anopheles culicifacies TaxID=139723 RepID=A0A182MLV3_9DIPT
MTASSPLAKTPMSRIPIRTANAEKRARASNCLPPEYDESKLSPSEIRALRAQKRAAWRQARLKSLENDALQALIMIQTMSAAGQLDDSVMNSSSASEGVDGSAGLPPAAEQPVSDSNASIPSPSQSPLPFDTVSSANSKEEHLGPNGEDERHVRRSSEEAEDGGDRLHQRFPRLAVKSRPGNEIVVRETEKVVEEKVTRRTEEAPGGGLRTVEYIEKVIETEVSNGDDAMMARTNVETKTNTSAPIFTFLPFHAVETMREKIIMFELEDSSSGDSDKMDVNNGVTEPDGHHHQWTEGSETERRQVIEVAEAVTDPEPIQLQTIVEVINPMLTGDGQPNDIAIGRYSDVLYGEEDSLVVAPASVPTEYGRYAYEHGAYESINDKMKHVLRELKQNEKVRQNLSKSLTEDEIIALQAQEAEEERTEMEEEDEEDVPERYEEKTGAIGTVFMVRERLINDFYTHQSELAQEQQQQQRMYHQKLLDDSASTYHDCEVITNPNAERFSPAFDKHSGPGQLYHHTLHSEKLKAVFGSDDDDEDEDEKEDEADDQRNGNVTVETVDAAAAVVAGRYSATVGGEDDDDDEGEDDNLPNRVVGDTTNGTSDTIHITTNTVQSGPNLTTSGASNKRKKRKGKKKKTPSPPFRFGRG